MINLLPDFMTDEMFSTVRDKLTQKLKSVPKPSRLALFSEGRCLHAMHIGSYEDEVPTLARLHKEIMPQSDLTFNGPHHDVYISDPRWVASDRLKAVLHQSVKPKER